MKKYTDRLTAIVTVADDGGGSGVLRREMGILPPGDVRQCMQALANTEPVMEQLLGYRFPEGQLKGQSFGNLLLAALNGMAGSFEEAVAMMGQVLAISGRVLPVTNADVQLEAVFENGARVVGESHIFNAKKQQDCRIHHVSLVPEHPKALPDALEAISEADLILLGPGSLYTSVIPNLLVNGVADAIRASHAQKFYICNIMTQDGETEGYTAAHINGIKEASGNISQVAKIAQLCGDELNIYSGNDDQVVPLLALGGKGVISVVSNVKPELVHNCCKAFFDGDTAKARELQLEMLPLADALFCEVNPIPVKYAMNVLGWEAGECRLPLVEPSEAHKEYIEKALRAEGLITE